jgi:hypothetical protein
VLKVSLQVLGEELEPLLLLSPAMLGRSEGARGLNVIVPSVELDLLEGLGGLLKSIVGPFVILN